MKLSEIKKAVNEGRTVCWKNGSYEVRKNKKDDGHYIICTMNNDCTGLTWSDGVTMNGQEQDFFIKDATP